MLKYSKHIFFNLNSWDYQAHTLLATYSYEFGIQQTNVNPYRVLVLTYKLLIIDLLN